MPTVLIDYREQKPYEFPDNRATDEIELDVGDYTLDGFEDIFSVERKTLDDLATSLGTDRERFEAEIQRAQSLDEFIVVIEASKRSVGAYKNVSDCPNYFSDIHPNSIIGTVEKWPQKYSTLSFEWCGTREQAIQETIQQLDSWYLDYSRSPNST